MERTAPHRPLTGRDNRTFQHLASLSDPKVRNQEQIFLIEGVKMVEEALRDRLGVRQVIAAPSLTQHHGKGVIKLAEGSGVEILWISERLLDRLSESRTPQPVMAVAEMRRPGEGSLLGGPAALIVLCHQLQDPGNVGTIIRTAEAAGAAGVAVTQNTADPYNAKSVRASMGSVLRVPIVRISDAAEYLGKCAQRGFQTVALALNGGETLYDVDLRGPTVLVLGQEGAGLPEELLANASRRVRIPMAESIDSLNVAVSAAVVLYEALRQRSTGSAPR